MVLTSVAGHISNLDFSPPNNSWSACQPSHLFQANIERTVSTQFEDLKKELEIQARKATVLVLWLDCDREGEAIADEVATICKESNRSLQIFRAHFSSVLPGEITNALNRLGRLDYKQGEDLSRSERRRRWDCIISVSLCKAAMETKVNNSRPPAPPTTQF